MHLGGLTQLINKVTFILFNKIVKYEFNLQKLQQGFLDKVFQVNNSKSTKVVQGVWSMLGLKLEYGAKL